MLSRNPKIVKASLDQTNHVWDHIWPPDCQHTNSGLNDAIYSDPWEHPDDTHFHLCSKSHVIHLGLSNLQAYVPICNTPCELNGGLKMTTELRKIHETPNPREGLHPQPGTGEMVSLVLLWGFLQVSLDIMWKSRGQGLPCHHQESSLWPLPQDGGGKERVSIPNILNRC
jgi:hypothetical protein